MQNLFTASLLPVSLLAQAASRPGMLELFLKSSLMAKFVFFLLAGLSVGSWAIMVSKAMQLRRATDHGRRFLDVFRQSKRFSEVNAAAGQLDATPMVGLFRAGYAEVDAQIKAAPQEARGDVADPSFRVKSLEGVQRSLRRAIGVEVAIFSRGQAFLATTAAASPFIGLFGTVWGIMIAFQDIGVTGSTSLDAVAPGIAEALINTAAGLAAAIPALVGFNYFGARLRQMRVEMEDFVLEFLNLTERNFT